MGVSSYHDNRAFTNQAQFTSSLGIAVQNQGSKKQVLEGPASMDANLSVVIPSAPQKQIPSMYNYESQNADRQKPGSAPIPYSGPSMTQSNSSNGSGVLFSAKSLMSPTSHDPVVSN